jgi:hypothetical protein
MNVGAALVVRSRMLQATFEVRHGGRMVSLRDQASGREWLVQPGIEPDDATYGSNFIQRRIHGWDEMLPTIDPCRVLGVDLPDHGEVWAVPWRPIPARHPAGIRLQIDSVAMPLRLVREAWPRGDDIVLSYALSNCGQSPLPFLWAAHPQFRVTAHARLLFHTQPSSVRIESPSDRAGVIDWSHAERLAEEQAAGSHLKVSIVAKDGPRCITLEDESCALRLAWQGKCVGYVAVLWDNAEFSHQRVIALEPSTSRHSSLGTAVEWGDIATIPAGESLTWRITLSVANASTA